jgi:transposase
VAPRSAPRPPPDARRLRELLQADRVPESWIPPEQILELRSKVRLRHTLIQERGE